MLEYIYEKIKNDKEYRLSIDEMNYISSWLAIFDYITKKSLSDVCKGEKSEITKKMKQDFKLIEKIQKIVEERLK